MRKLIITLLLAGTAATPAMAQEQNGGRRDRGGQSSQSDDGERARPARVRAERAERSERQERPAVENASRRVAERMRERDDGGATTPVNTEQRSPRLVRQSDDGSQRTQVRRERRGEIDSLGEAAMTARRAQMDRPVIVDRDRDRDRDQTRRHRDGDRQWSNHWRSDRRYDWRRYRSHNRSIFRFGSYYDPYGYRYRRFSIGFNLWPSYYRSSYWLNDPWQYRLPPAYGPYRWVRYWNDALLVNIYTGEVVDVEHNFFW